MNYLSKKKKKKIFFCLIIIIISVLVIAIIIKLVKLNNCSTELKKELEVLNLSNSDSFFKNKQDYDKIFLTLGGQEIEAELVISPEAKFLGLSGRKELAEGRGMLFIFKENSSLSFVMREMNFPIDIVYINQGVIKKIYANLEPEGKLTTKSYDYFPADMVLELPATYMERHNLSEGMKISIIEK